eukprot:gene36982-45617_t
MLERFRGTSTVKFWLEMEEEEEEVARQRQDHNLILLRFNSRFADMKKTDRGFMAEVVDELGRMIVILAGYEQSIMDDMLGVNQLSCFIIGIPNSTMWNEA